MGQTSGRSNCFKLLVNEGLVRGTGGAGEEELRSSRCCWPSLMCVTATRVLAPAHARLVPPPAGPPPRAPRKLRKTRFPAAWLRVSLSSCGVGAGNEFLLNLALGRASFGPRNYFLSAQKGQNLRFSRADLGPGARGEHISGASPARRDGSVLVRPPGAVPGERERVSSTPAQVCDETLLEKQSSRLARLWQDQNVGPSADPPMQHDSPAEGADARVGGEERLPGSPREERRTGRRTFLGALQGHGGLASAG